MKAQITINVQTYSGPEQMPPEVRRQYDFAMRLAAGKDGIPHVLEGEDTSVKAGVASLIKSNIVCGKTTTRILVNGQEYSQWEDLPPAIRGLIDKAVAAPHVKTALEASAPPSSSANLPLQPLAAPGLRIGFVSLVLLLLAAMLLGMLIAWKALR